MTVYRADQMPQWVRKVEAITNAVIQQATNDMLNDIKIEPGVTRGGRRRKGTIPRMDGAIAASLQSTLYNTTSLSVQGEASHKLVIPNMSAGVRAEFLWGGAAAPHARANHYGWSNVAGTFWVDVAAQGWRGYVRGAVIKAKAAIR